MELSTSPILVTGATGFVASHVIKLLLERGYKVRGTVRSLAKKDKYDFLYNLVPEKKDNLELVEADLLRPETWNAAVEGIEYVMHIASPFPSVTPQDENELIKPAVEGTLNVLQAAIEKGVKKVVLTSSVVSVYYGNEGKVCGPEDWSVEEHCSAYAKSKVRAEKAAWDLWKKHEGKFELATVNPGLVMGPIYSSNNGTSEEIVADLFREKVAALPQLHLTMVDVRDVAECHLQAMLSPVSNGKRYICSAQSLWYAEMANILRQEFAQYGYKFPKLVVGKCVLSVIGLWDKRARSIKPEINVERRVNNELSIQELGIKYRPLQETLNDMGHSLIKAGIVPDKVTKQKK
jgi:nucleoside-diphosphate-sugar epimerase